MCCFSGPITRVSNTRIFARLDGDRQLLAYQMMLSTAHEVAMVLPVPVPPGSREDAVRFIDLSAEPWLFSRLRELFETTGDQQVDGGLGEEAPAAAAERLEVHQVGAFEASFVPSPDDFGRLDRRFRLPSEVLSLLPEYADWGFVVFKLRPAARDTVFHPMAFSFPTREPGRAYFPCVHVHDGQLHEEAHFDHQLFAQLGRGAVAGATGWRRSTGVLAAAGAPQVIDPEQLGFYRRLEGTLPNTDLWLSARPESADDTELRLKSWRVAVESRKARAEWERRSRREELLGRVLRGVVGLPLAVLLGFLTFIADERIAAAVFGVVWLPAVWVVAHALTNRARWAVVATVLAALAAALSRFQ